MSLRKATLLTLFLIIPGQYLACAQKNESKHDMSEHKFTNNLINENSPYLLSHAHNPVNWYPWGEEALSKAKAENKVIFLSIGYAACHWCHVMERESFENESIAAILNEHYVCIKVDREQRPDLDEIYMSFTTAMTGRGGWPMSVFLTPDRKPFFAGTYFPPEDRYGRPGFRKILTEISTAYSQNKVEILASADKIYSELSNRINQKAASTVLNHSMIGRGATALMNNFDHNNGGFGGAPKFPHATELSLFIRHSVNSGDESFMQAADKALQGMAYGGIYDQIGGGFARYSTDERWLVPHFEKMLYDNALLVPVYKAAYQVGGNEVYLRIIRETLNFVLTELTDKTGGFYSALDADSEGEEGKFYVWSKAEIDSILGDDATLFNEYYNISSRGNFEGHNIPNITSYSHRVRTDNNEIEFDEFLNKARTKLFEKRSHRIRPLTDDKILTSWNGLMLSALAQGYQVTGEKKYLKAAQKNASFVTDELFAKGKLVHSYREGRKSEGEFLEDYGFYLRGLLDLLESDGDVRWLNSATKLADRAIELFADGSGTLYLRPDGQDDLIYRPREETDGALPSSGSFLIHSLFRLNRITDDKKYLAAGDKFMRAISGTIVRQPSAMTSALLALDFQISDKIEIVISGKGKTRDEMLKLLYGRYIPNCTILFNDTGDKKVSPLFEGRAVTGDEVRAYVCRNSVCQLPVSTVAELKTELDKL